MKHFRPPVLVKRPAREVLRDACGLMADGRWRTACDVAVSIRCKPSEASQALIDLRKRGLLVREWIRHTNSNVAIYCKREAQQ